MCVCKQTRGKARDLRVRCAFVDIQTTQREREFIVYHCTVYAVFIVLR